MISSQDMKNRIITLIKAETAQSPEQASKEDFWRALSRVVIEQLTDRWEKTRQTYQKGRQAHYFSAEFLEGRSLMNNLINLDLLEVAETAVLELGYSMAELVEQENDPGLGNGGLGRLAACFLDSAATYNLPVTGYGILYRYGLFRQEISHGFQKEYPDAWMEKPYPFLVRRDQERVRVHYQDLDVIAVPYDMPITGYGTCNINTLKLWKAEPAEEFDFNLFNAQRFDDAVIQRNRVNDICRVLYPNDSSYDGKVLRVRQQYFFVSASLQTLVKQTIKLHGDNLTRFAEVNTIQLNDTHPVIAIPELMRILVDEHKMNLDEAWRVTRQTFAYTNHTIMTEALESWDVNIFRFLFPRIMQIIEWINQHFWDETRQHGLNEDQIRYMAPIGDNQVRMAWLAVYASFSVNGVAALHTRILKERTLHAFYQLWPDRFNSKTNGVTPRRWLKTANPRLTQLLTEVSGNEKWVTDLTRLDAVKHMKNDSELMRRLGMVKHHNKERLVRFIQKEMNLEISPEMLFDVQIKRLHEYKRQLLNAFLILDDYFRIKDHPDDFFIPRVYFFGAKAAPGYFRAKAIIKFINEVARLIHEDSTVHSLLRVIFLPNYNVSWAERLFPAADVSEQLSTVGMEASGTGNMKFMMNGALTLGTRDGANIEIAEAVGPEAVYLFGCCSEDFPKTQAYYNPQWQYEHIEGLQRCVDTLIDGTLDDQGTGMFRDLYHSLLYGSDSQPADPYYVLGDFDAYRKTRSQIHQDYRNQIEWATKCWINITSSGRFSSDRTIQAYAQDIWSVQPQNAKSKL
jgi:glycogen phosphorylase